jgi:hypothetical protein
MRWRMMSSVTRCYKSEKTEKRKEKGSTWACFYDCLGRREGRTGISERYISLENHYRSPSERPASNLPDASLPPGDRDSVPPFQPRCSYWCDSTALNKRRTRRSGRPILRTKQGACKQELTHAYSRLSMGMWRRMTDDEQEVLK